MLVEIISGLPEQAGVKVVDGSCPYIAPVQPETTVACVVKLPQATQLLKSGLQFERIQ